MNHLQSYQHATTTTNPNGKDDDAVVDTIEHPNHSKKIRNIDSDCYQHLHRSMTSFVSRNCIFTVSVVLLLVVVVVLLLVVDIMPTIRRNEEILLRTSPTIVNSVSLSDDSVSWNSTNTTTILPLTRYNYSDDDPTKKKKMQDHDTKQPQNDDRRARMIRQQLLYIQEHIDGTVYFPYLNHHNDDQEDEEEVLLYTTVATGWIKQYPSNDRNSDNNYYYYNNCRYRSSKNSSLNATCFNNSHRNKIGIVIIQVQNERDVQIVVPILSQLQHNYLFPFRIRSGGHHKLGYSSLSDVRNSNEGGRGDGAVLCLAKLNHIRMIPSEPSSVSSRAKKKSNDYTSIVIGPAVLVQDILQQVTIPYQYGGVIGFCSQVAEGGFVLGGGFGIQSRLHGLGLDNVVSFRIVVANGTTLTTTSSSLSSPDNSNSDLHWALLGAGSGSYGVITEMEYIIYPVSDILPVLQIQFHEQDTTNLAHFLYHIGNIESKTLLPDNIIVMHDEYKSVWMLWTGTNDAEVKNGNVILSNLVESIMLSGSTTYPFDIKQSTMSWKGTFGSSNSSLSTDTNSSNDMNSWANEIWAAACWTGFLLPENNTIDVWNEITHFMDIGIRNSQPYLSPDVELWGGAINRHASNATAFPYRTAIYNVGVLLMIPVNEPNASDVFDRESKKVNEWWYNVDRFLTGSYVNYPTHSLLDHDDPHHYAKILWGDNLPRLVRIKQQYDPNNVFRFPMSVPPELSAR